MASAYVSYLFGETRPWNANEWTDSDDRVRGGSSCSHLSIEEGSSAAVFHGHLDTQTLGGAGFASQRTKDGAAGAPWDLSQFDAIRLRLLNEDAGQCDGKRYTLVLKDDVLPRRPDGRESSSVSWEAEFVYPAAMLSTGINARSKAIRDVIIPWSSFKAMYRGKPKPDANPLDLSAIKRMSIMMRSFFDEQSGDFKLTIASIAATKVGPGVADAPQAHIAASDSTVADHVKENTKQKSRWRFSCCGSPPDFLTKRSVKLCCCGLYQLKPEYEERSEQDDRAPRPVPLA